MTDGDDPPQGERRRRNPSLIFPIVGMVIGFIAALLVLRALNLGGGGDDLTQPADQYQYLPGYFADINRLIEDADFDLAVAIPSDRGETCAAGGDGYETACRQHRENLRQGVPRAEQFRDALFDLDPPEHAAEWHQRYLTAVSQLHAAFNAQFEALADVDRDGFLRAYDRAAAASADAAQLRIDFHDAFRDEREP